MNCFVIFMVFFAASAQFVAGNPTNSPNCTNADRLDSLVNQIFGFASSAQRFPQTKEEFKVFCLKQSNQIGDLEVYKSRCPLNGRRASLLSLTVISLKHWNGQLCRNEGNNKLSRTLLASASCANEAANGYRSCLNRLIEQMRTENKATNVHLRVARMCCSYHRVFSCMSDTASSLPSCTEAAIETNKQYIHLLIDRTMEYLCADYNEVTDKCDKLGKSAPRKVAKNGKVPVKPSLDVELKPFFTLLLNYLSQ